jgi:predicted nucleic-acid-binding protein
MTMTILDTNVLVRLVLDDDRHQSDVAFEVLNSATAIIVPTLVFCEFVWVMRSIRNSAGGRKYSKNTIAESIRSFIEFDHVFITDDEVEAGLQMLDAGGDFADGVIEYTSRSLARNSAATFVSFDKNAVGTLVRRGLSALLLH